MRLAPQLIWIVLLCLNTQITHSAQIDDDVKEVLKRQSSSQSLNSWEASGYRPRAVFDNAKALHSEQALCDALGKLTDTELSVFEEAIEQVLGQKNFPCASQLMGRIEEYWKPQTEVSIEPTTAGTQSDRQSASVFLMFTGGPHPRWTKAILALLDHSKIKASFLFTGKQIKSHPEILKAAYEGGHAAGVSSFSGNPISGLSIKDLEREIGDSIRVFKEIAGRGPSLFFHPYGAPSEEAIEKVLQSNAMKTQEPGTDVLDWKFRSVAEFITHFKSKLASSSLKKIQFGDSRLTTLALPLVLEELKKRGMQPLAIEGATRAVAGQKKR